MVRVAAPKGLVVKRFSQGALVGHPHHHGCTQCHVRYEDNCETPEVDGVCNSCICGRRQSYQEVVAPQDCCRALCTRATNKERITYRLAGPGPWFICTTCKRQHPLNPSGGSQ